VLPAHHDAALAYPAVDKTQDRLSRDRAGSGQTSEPRNLRKERNAWGKVIRPILSIRGFFLNSEEEPRIKRIKKSVAACPVQTPPSINSVLSVVPSDGLIH
jgi:hypothetical protein